MSWTDLVHAFRAILARPAFSALVVAVLAAGLACVLYVAGLVNGLVVRPLPFADADRLYHAGLVDNGDPLDTDDLDTLDTWEFLDWRERLAGVAELAGWGVATINLSDGERPERYAGAYVTANLWPTLGVAPALGRGFVADDEVPGANAVVILSDAVWRARYLADPAIVGRRVRVNTLDATVVGVMPPGFAYPAREQLWLPTPLARDAEGNFNALLRPHDGVPLDRVQIALDGWLEDLQRERPDYAQSRVQAVRVRPLSYGFVSRETRGLFVLMFASVVVVLLIACANVANLMLTQITSRAQELAVRVALGASRRRLVAHLLAQTGLLSLAAVALALPAAQLAIRATEAMFKGSDDGPPHWMSFDLDGTLVAAALGAALLTALVTGVLPALRASASAGPSLHQGGRSVVGGGFAKASRALVVGEIALSCAMLMATGTIVQAIRDLDRFDLGMRTDGVLTARIALFEARYPDDPAVHAYVRGLLDALRADPQVESASVSSSLPGLMGSNIDVLAQGAPLPEDGLANPGHSAVDARFFETMGATLVAGRVFSEADRADTAPVIVVDETFVARHVPGGSPLGKEFVLDPLDAEGARTATIVGVVRPIQMEDIDDAIEAAVFTPYVQDTPRFLSVMVRTRGAPEAFAERLRAIAAGIDADTPAYWVRSYDDVLREATFGERVLVRVFGGFGLVALLLAAAGLYGVVAFSVAQRTREIGVRRALGESDAGVLVAVGARSALQVGVGLALGALAGVPFARLLAASINQGHASHEAGWLAVVVLLALVSALAVWVPARRALKVDPIVALRHE